MTIKEFIKKYKGRQLYKQEQGDHYLGGMVEFLEQGKQISIFLPTIVGYGYDQKLQRKVYRELKSTGAKKKEGKKCYYTISQNSV